MLSRANTDFWPVTHYGFIRNTGHFYHEQRTGDFTIQVKIETLEPFSWQPSLVPTLTKGNAADFLSGTRALVCGVMRALEDSNL
ncbi:MAG: DUF1349 domain-containing protein [Verrucomicrobia bacterium]|nr:DUF1349 domain-containing protein [Verrucomicrobiota bacterium]